ncbi:uncharacterized protein JCM15063_006089 [Sporobolomyces koalae]|uniref:uncharacterized protein n=1 Tax=Sporobolomyces koalae TaxID=500713 RepID=UPI003170091F
MSTAQPRIALRPPPHRDYLQGYPGIPACDPATDPPPSRQDPILPLPHQLRPQAFLSGTVEIRSPNKGPPIRAKSLSLELEKIETIPPQLSDDPGGRHHDKSKDKDRDETKREGRFVELIGTGPSRIWVAGVDVPHDEIDTPIRKKGFKGMLKKNGQDDEEDDGFDVIPDGNYPFNIPLPEGLPPTTEVDFKSNGISYQIVASLCIKGKKGLLKGASKPIMLIASATIILHKADILPVFPVYSPILIPPIPAKLPWAIAGGLTVGEAREAKSLISRGFGHVEGGIEGGEVSMKATRKGSAFGPGDSVQLFVELGWGGVAPIRLTRLGFVLQEEIIFRYPSPKNPSYLLRSPARSTAILSASANKSADFDGQHTLAMLDNDAVVGFSLSGLVPTTHTRVTVRTAKHIDVSYHLKVTATIEGGDEISIDQWPVVIGNVNARVARGIITDIGYVEGLCKRPGLEEAQEMLRQDDLDDNTPLAYCANSRPQDPYRPAVPSSDHNDSPATFSDASTEKRQLFAARLNGGSYHVSNETHANGPSVSSSSGSPAPLAATPERPTPVRPRFAPSPTAEEEKRRYYDAATKSRDTLQGLRVDQEQYEHARSLQHHHESSLSPISDQGLSPVAFHQAPIHKLTREPAAIENPATTLGYTAPFAGVSRSNTTYAASGSYVSSAADESRSPPQPAAVTSSSSLSVGTAMLGRSLTSAESEKKRLFLEAKEMARARQEEARLELERQNKVLEDFEFEEAQRDFEESLILGAEEERRKEEELERERFERRLELERVEKLAQFEREQRQAQEQRQAEADRWARERKEEDEMKKRKAEEFKPIDEQKAREENERRNAHLRKIEMERQRIEDEQRREANERARIEQAERRLRAQEEEDRRRQERERREREEYERHLQEEEHRRRVEQERRDEAENRRVYLEEVARRRADEQARSNRQEYAASNGYNSSHEIRASTSPRPFASELDRAPSVASFAPSMSAAKADSTFYAQAIASGQHSMLNEEKAAYLRQLRQGQSQGSSPPSQQRSHVVQPMYAHLEQQSGTYSPINDHAREPYPSPPAVRDPRVSTRSITPTPDSYHAPTPSIPASSSNGYKSAAEEKAEAAARRRAEDDQRAALTSASSTVPAPATDDEEVAPPSYPVPGSSVSTAPRSAAEEKEELSAYYRAKQAVDAQRAHPVATPATAPAYPQSLGSNGYSYQHKSPTAPPLDPHQGHYPSPSSSEMSRPRDPEVSIGKQRASSGSYSNPNGFHHSEHPSAPPHTVTSSSSIPRQYVEEEAGIGPDGFASFNLDTRFPEFDMITNQIAARSNDNEYGHQ